MFKSKTNTLYTITEGWLLSPAKYISRVENTTVKRILQSLRLAVRR